ncbi:hypothetical protein GCM10017750_06740 [Streptomyces racemochromogenes]
MPGPYAWLSSVTVMAAAVPCSLVRVRLLRKSPKRKLYGSDTPGSKPVPARLTDRERTVTV